MSAESNADRMEKLLDIDLGNSATSLATIILTMKTLIAPILQITHKLKTKLDSVNFKHLKCSNYRIRYSVVGFDATPG